ncbi:MAG: GMC family oxidoreductase [Sphingobacteriales bacterium]|nr:MAG: GMC family oxidoreductase [Sphingobacteriales bacterium]
MKRRKFIGLSALATASFYGSTIISTVSCKKDKQKTDTNYQAIVVGSGFGGSIVALRLAEKGINTLLIEMGKFYDVTQQKNTFSSNLPPDKRSTWLNNKSELPFGPNLGWKDKYTGVLDKVEFPNMNIYRNICLGGGSISNGGVLFAPTEQHFSQYISNEINYSQLANTYFPRVKQMLQATPMPADLFNSEHYKFAQVAKEHALNAGYNVLHADSFYNFDIWRKETQGEIEKSALNGELLYGNNNGIKNSLDRNYLAEALGTGKLTIKTLSKVTDVSFSTTTEKYQVEVETISDTGVLLDKQAFNSEYLFVCAGSVGTSEILVKAREKGNLPELNLEVGKGFGSNGNAFAIRNNINKPTGNIHTSPPTLSILDYDNPIAPLTAMQDIFPIGIDLRILLMVGQPYNEYRGKFNFDTSNNNFSLDWAANGMDQPKAAMRYFIDRLNSANGSGLDTLFIKSGVSDNFTYHALGGCVLGKSSDMFGRLNGYKKLYAICGSMLPGNSGLVNPTLTIAALAERNIEQILKEDFS